VAARAGYGDGDDRLHDRLHLGDDDPAGSAPVGAAAQWTVTAYALATAALIALGGRLVNIVGHERIVAIGIVPFAGASTPCELTPRYVGGGAVVDRVPGAAGDRRGAADPVDDGAGPQPLSNAWGWDSLATIGSIVVGLVILALFVLYERRVEQLTLFLFFTWLASSSSGASTSRCRSVRSPRRPASRS
jgi:hypothetical protein